MNTEFRRFRAAGSRDKWHQTAGLRRQTTLTKEVSSYRAWRDSSTVQQYRYRSDTSHDLPLPQ